MNTACGNKIRRLFFALLPDDSTKQALQQISASLLLSSRQRVRTENWHITLVFIGHVDDTVMSNIIETAMLINTPEMTVVFDQLEYWRGAGIACLTCSQPEPTIANLVTQLSIPLTALGLQLDTRPYCPHVTLARHVHELPTAVFQPIMWNANQFTLMESVSDPSGVIYRPLKCWQLAHQT